MEETNKKGELLKRIEAEATGLDGKINDKDLSVSIDIVRNKRARSHVGTHVCEASGHNFCARVTMKKIR